VKSKGYTEDTRLGNWKLGIGAAVIAVALLAQFYPKKFPQNRDFLLGCIALYPFLHWFALSFGYDESALDLISVENRVELLLVAVDP
jgi:signal peptidase complex subunit 2